MTAEQLQAIAWLTVGVVFGTTIAYSTWRRKLKFPLYRAWILLLFISMFVVDSLEGHTLWTLFAWASSIIGLSLVFDIFTLWGKELNHKLVIGSLLIVTIVGGILVNAYAFSTPTSFGARIFSLAVFTLMITPIIFALIAYFKGKNEHSKRLLSLAYSGGKKDEA